MGHTHSVYCGDETLLVVTFKPIDSRLITSPARRAWRSYKFASLDFSGGFFGAESWAATHGRYRWHQVV